MRGRKQTADDVILGVLVYESTDDAATSERKIKRRLRYHNAGSYRPTRVKLLRSLVMRLYREMRRPRESRYFTPGDHPHAALTDFDMKRMVRDLRRTFPTVPARTLEEFVPFAIYLYYLR